MSSSQPPNLYFFLQLSARFPGLKLRDVRGNLNTRLRKLDAEDGEYAALILAVAGVERMGWRSRISETLDAEACLGRERGRERVLSLKNNFN